MSTPPTRPSPARDKFIDVLRSRGMLRPGEEWVIDANLRAYAHELAEQIRNSEELREATDDHMSDCNMAADLIDPEVQR